MLAIFALMLRLIWICLTLVSMLTLLMLIVMPKRWMLIADSNVDHGKTDARTDLVDADANADHVDADGYADHVVGIISNDWIFSGRPGHRSWH